MINKEIRKTLKQIIPILTLCMCFGITAGLLLNLSDTWLEKELVVGILIITPAIMALGGYISSIFGMRITTALYSGMIEPKIRHYSFLENNLIALLILSLIISITVGAVSYLVVYILNLNTSLNLWSFIFISTIAGLIDFIICLIITIPVAFISFYKGLDPDNLTSPLMNSLSDLLSILSIFIALNLYLTLY
ncbi:MAG: magnesium transporter [Candidatus Helarchaeota archaeon]